MRRAQDGGVMERIVLGYDGSPPAVSALRWVALRATRGATTIDVVHVSPRFPVAHGTEGLELLANAGAFLDAHAPDVEVNLHRLEGGVVGTITDFARDADLLVAGIGNEHPVRGLWAGGGPLRMAMTAAIPVCLVPEDWVDIGAAVTVGITQDASSARPLEFGIGEALAGSVPLRLVHAWLMPAGPLGDEETTAGPPETGPEVHRAVLTAAGEAARRHPRLAVEEELVRDSPSAALLRFTAVSSMLVLGGRRQGHLEQPRSGTVVRAVLSRAECPVCVVPAGGTEEWER